MKENKGRSTGFILGFLITIIVAILISFSLLTLSRMENTISPSGFTVLSVEKNFENKINLIILNKNYFLDFQKTRKIIGDYSTYSVLIPSEIRTFFGVVKTGIDAVGVWVETIFLS